MARKAETGQSSDGRRIGRLRVTTAAANIFITTIAKQDRRFTVRDITQQRRTRMLNDVTTVKKILSANLPRRLMVKNHY